MKFAINSEHRHFFDINGYITFSELLTPEQLHKLVNDLQQGLVNRLKLDTHFSLTMLPPNELFIQGRDLWRDLPAIKKAVCNPSLAEIAWEFCQARPLRLAYTQFLPKGPISSKSTPLQQMRHLPPTTLAELSAVQGVVSGLILCLSGIDHAELIEQEEQPQSATVISTNTGEGTYFSPDYPIDFSLLNDKCDYLMILYGVKNSVFIADTSDPLGYTLKHWGYTYNDKLTDKLNPIILR